MEIFSFRVVRQSTVKKTRHKSVEKVERRRSKAEQSPPPGLTALIWTSLKCGVCNRVEASLRAQGHLREGLMDRTHWMRCPTWPTSVGAPNTRRPWWVFDEHHVFCSLRFMDQYCCLNVEKGWCPDVVLCAGFTEDSEVWGLLLFGVRCNNKNI